MEFILAKKLLDILQNSSPSRIFIWFVYLDFLSTEINEALQFHGGVSLLLQLLLYDENDDLSRSSSMTMERDFYGFCHNHARKNEAQIDRL